MSRPEEASTSSSSRSPVLPNGRALRILYVNHSNALRDVARICFRRLGHTLVGDDDGLLALERIARDPTFDLVMIEHELPDMNGLRLVTLLRAQNYTGKIVVLCSSLSAGVEAEYGRHNVDLIMFKPVLPSDLRKCLSGLFPGSGRVG